MEAAAVGHCLGQGREPFLALTNTRNFNPFRYGFDARISAEENIITAKYQIEGMNDEWLVVKLSLSTREEWRFVSESWPYPIATSV